MRHFIVLGFATVSKDEVGQCLHLGHDRDAALNEVNAPGNGCARKELFELAVPYMRRQCAAASAEPEPGSKEDNRAGEEDEADTTKLPPISEAAQGLIDQVNLTAAQLAEIEPTGAGGGIIKKDVEAYLKRTGHPDYGPEHRE